MEESGQAFSLRLCAGTGRSGVRSYRAPQAAAAATAPSPRPSPAWTPGTHRREEA